MLDIALLGATGRMGHALLAALRERTDLRLVGALASAGSAALGLDAGIAAGGREIGVGVTSDPELALAGARVAVDFSAAAVTQRHVAACVAHGCALVLGVTGLDAEQHERLRTAAQRVPIVYAPNMSLAVNVCFALVARAARALPDYDVEILDLHHRHKRDAPSGTALRCGELIAAAREQALCALTGDRNGARPVGAIGFASLRLGEIAGEHTVLFASPDERVEITHRATSRASFAAGALAAARWVSARAPGLYGMHDVLGLESPPA